MDEDLAVRECPVSEFRFSAPVTGQKTVTVSVTTRSEQEGKRTALIELRALDEGGGRVTIPSWPRSNDRIGEFFYLPNGHAAPALESVEVRLPPETVALELIGHQWKRGARDLIVGNPTIESALGVGPAELPDGPAVEVSSGALSLVANLEETTELIRLRIAHSSASDGGGVPVLVKFLDAEENEILPTGELPVNANFGPFVNLIRTKTGAEEVRNLSVPPGARSLVLSGVPDWKRQTSITSCAISQETGVEAKLAAFLADCSPDSLLAVIDSTASPMGQETTYSRPNNMATSYAELGVHVVFFPSDDLQGSKTLIAPHLVQLPRESFNRAINFLAINRHGPSNVYICSSYAGMHAVSASDSLHEAGWRVIYEALDDAEELKRIGRSRWYEPDLERAMLERADLIVAVSPRLSGKLQTLLPNHMDILVSPNATLDSFIEHASSLRGPDALELRSDSRTVGYVGHLTETQLDWEMLIAAAQELPDVNFDLVGPGAPTDISVPSNVRLYGVMPQVELESLVGTWKVGLVPMKSSLLTRSGDSSKIYDYLAWGLRCVTADTGLASEYPSTWTYSNAEELVSSLRQAVSSPVTVEELASLDDFARQATWNKRAAEMLAAIELEDRS